MGKRIITILFIILLPTIVKADGQDFIVWFSDGVKFLIIFSWWTIGILVLLTIIKTIRKKEFSKKQKYIIWTFGLLLGFFHWTMIKSDSYPNSGPIDSIVYKDLVEKSRIKDSLELFNGKADSTIESTIASIDTNDIGVYIWLNHKRIFVRKLTPGLYQRQNDSLTMSIVRQWKKE